ncbi:hypothetical protein PP178_06945 [Zeaxanthinibacter sp. PT1]|uniref:hypothetical protein n=1 Tax=Zeaxanthinibacter TaxID=561554 RepID=UPI002349CFCB|nr:hypothetical protein [Zeaxanthinibacter sp. PT1]MDC6351286.1 hypothetical protein [Zeaxanthinibacter sp. PT1]
MIVVFRPIFLKNYVGLSLWPLIILKADALRADSVLINHEKIHLRQQRELLIIPFYLFYFTEWLIRLLYYRNAYNAYKNLSFEKEAYHNETNLDYLKTRKPFTFIKYL